VRFTWIRTGICSGIQTGTRTGMMTCWWATNSVDEAVDSALELKDELEVDLGCVGWAIRRGIGWGSRWRIAWVVGCWFWWWLAQGRHRWGLPGNSIDRHPTTTHRQLIGLCEAVAATQKGQAQPPLAASNILGSTLSAHILTTITRPRSTCRDTLNSYTLVLARFLGIQPCSRTIHNPAKLDAWPKSYPSTKLPSPHTIRSPSNPTIRLLLLSCILHRTSGRFHKQGRWPACGPGCTHPNTTARKTGVPDAGCKPKPTDQKIATLLAAEHTYPVECLLRDCSNIERSWSHCRVGMPSCIEFEHQSYFNWVAKI